MVNKTTELDNISKKCDELLKQLEKKFKKEGPIHIWGFQTIHQVD